VIPIFQRQQGAMMLEALLAATLVAISALGAVSLMTRSLKLLQRTAQAIEPLCEYPHCSYSGRASVCACGESNKALVIH